MNQLMHTETLENGIQVSFIPSSKFKTVSVGFFLHQELREDLASMTALLPSVLKRGSRAYPDTLTLRRALEHLYGAELMTEIIKKGERHIIACLMEMVHGQYVGEKEGLLEQGLSILSSVVGEPLQEGGGFKQDYLEQEKDQLTKEIKGLINDKSHYALEKCFALMCAAERFGVYKLGSVDGVGSIGAAALWGYYQGLLTRNPVDLFVVGDLEPKRVLETVRGTLGRLRRSPENGLPATEINKEPGKLKEEVEIIPVSQAKLVLGFRTNTGYSDPLQGALLMYNGILGGFPHSKLFVNVREKASLAYYVFSRLERHKGLMVIAAGIDGDDYEKARAIIEEQLEAMAAGKISDTELENTRRGLINHLRTLEDSPYQMIGYYLDGAIERAQYTPAEQIQGIEAVTLDDIKTVAQKIRPEIVYLLRGGQGGRD